MIHCSDLIDAPLTYHLKDSSYVENDSIVCSFSDLSLQTAAPTSIYTTNASLR